MHSRIICHTVFFSTARTQQVNRDSPIVLHDKECPIIQKDCSMDYQYLARCVMIEINHFRRREGLDTLHYSPTLTVRVADSLLRVSAKRGKSFKCRPCPILFVMLNPDISKPFKEKRVMKRWMFNRSSTKQGMNMAIRLIMNM